MVITDPPYNVAIDGHVSGLGSVKHAEFLMASGEMSEQEFITFLHDSLQVAMRSATTLARDSASGASNHTSQIPAASTTVFNRKSAAIPNVAESNSLDLGKLFTNITTG
jgi:hypothetical protein